MITSIICECSLTNKVIFSSPQFSCISDTRSFCPHTSDRFRDRRGRSCSSVCPDTPGTSSAPWYPPAAAVASEHPSGWRPWPRCSWGRRRCCSRCCWWSELEAVRLQSVGQDPRCSESWGRLRDWDLLLLLPPAQRSCWQLSGPC